MTGRGSGSKNWDSGNKEVVYLYGAMRRHKTFTPCSEKNGCCRAFQGGKEEWLRVFGYIKIENRQKTPKKSRICNSGCFKWTHRHLCHLPLHTTLITSACGTISTWLYGYTALDRRMHFFWGGKNTHRPNLTLVFSLCQMNKLTQSNSLTRNTYLAMKNALILKKKNNTNFEFSQ